VTTKLFGERVQRVEDAKLVTGRANYLDDLGHEALAAAFVRSPHAHARIVDIDASGALDVDGLVAIYAYDDLAAASTPVGEPLPLLIPHPDLHAPRTGYALARDEVNHVGEAIVMVVASDRYIAEDAAERISVTYDVLPPVVGVDNARRAERTVHDDVPDNVAAHMVQSVGDIEAAMAAAPPIGGRGPGKSGASSTPSAGTPPICSERWARTIARR
jgi:CO/xanthine dehydrogenase Mo-binding subunit